jgi:hypothetical protein
MNFRINSHLLRKAALWMVPLAFLSGTTMYAQSGYGYDDDHAVRHHQKHEKRDLKEHQREERYLYGDGWALRQHQREERHQLRHHQHDERNYRNYDDAYGYRDRDYGYRNHSEDRYRDRDGYYSRPY